MHSQTGWFLEDAFDAALSSKLARRRALGAKGSTRTADALSMRR